MLLKISDVINFLGHITFSSSFCKWSRIKFLLFPVDLLAFAKNHFNLKYSRE